MIDLTSPTAAKSIKQDIDFLFHTPQGKNVLEFMKQIGGWNPTMFDSMETNDIVARDANRRLIGTLITMMDLSPEQIVALAKRQGVPNGE